MVLAMLRAGILGFMLPGEAEVDVYSDQPTQR